MTQHTHAHTHNYSKNLKQKVLKQSRYIYILTYCSYCSYFLVKENCLWFYHKWVV